MALARERLEAIDRELAALGKSDEELDGVVRRARALVAALDDVDDALATLSNGREDAAAAAAAAAIAAAARSVPKGLSAYPEEAFRDSDLPPADAPAEAPASRASAPPPDFDDDSTDIRHVDDALVAAATPPPEERARRSSDIAGLSVDELFADAEPAAPAESGESGLADLFDDEPLGVEEPSSGLASLEDELEGESASPPTRVEASQPAMAEQFPAFGDEEEEESTHVLGADDLAGMVEVSGADDLGNSDEFELLVDEDVLVLESEDEQPPAETEEAAAAEGDEEKGGLISRILGRK